MATILSLAMMLRHSFDMAAEAAIVEKAVRAVLREGFRTQDIQQRGSTVVGTVRMGDLVAEKVRSLMV